MLEGWERPFYAYECALADGRRRWEAQIRDLVLESEPPRLAEALPMMGGSVLLFGPRVDAAQGWMDLSGEAGEVFLAWELGLGDPA